MLPNLLITGIPRSGTSYFCKCIDGLPNAVAINEPAELFWSLQNEQKPYGIAGYYDSIRAKIVSGEKIQNKLLNGELTTDTLLADKRELYQPSFKNENLLIATKNTMSYISRLKDILDTTPEIMVIALVRNPLDTIASWINSFEHLRKADVVNIPVGNIDDPYLSVDARKRLMEINKVEESSVKRALLWSHLAKLITDEIERIRVLRYEDFSVSLQPTLQDISKLTGEEIHIGDKHTIKSVSKRHLLSQEDICAVIEHCSEQADLLDYDLAKSKDVGF